MRRMMTYLILSLFIAVGSVEAFADRHDSRGKDRERHEQRDKASKKRNSKDYKKGKDNRKDHGNGWSLPAPGKKAPAPRHKAPAPRHYAPAPHHSPNRHTPPPPPPRLGHMVRYATNGCHDVAVWQVDPYTYIVKYRKGRRYYTRMLYPYADRYGEPNTISVNWQPLSPWNLIPSINLNINL